MAKKRIGERPDGLIQLSLQIGYKPDGRPDRKHFYGRSRAEAERKREAYRKSMASSVNPDITVSAWVDFYLETYRPRVNEVYLKMDAVPYNRLKKRLGKLRVVDVRGADLQSALNEVSGMSFSTVDKYCQAIKRVFERAKKNKLIAENPAEDLILPTYYRGTHRALAPWEIELIVNNYDYHNSRAGLWVLLMLLCGLRRSEMMAIRWEDINLEKRTLEVRAVAVIDSNQSIIEERAKTDAGLRVLPIPQILFDALSSVQEEDRAGLVCLSAHGKQLSESGVRSGLKTFANALERILNGEPPLQPGRRTDLEKKRAKKKPLPERKVFSFRSHDLRHTYATALYDAGVPVKAAQYFLGHADIRITMELYTHLSKEREAASRLQMVAYLDKWLDNRVLNPVVLNLPESEKIPEKGDF